VTLERNLRGRAHGGIAALAVIILLSASEPVNAELARDPHQAVVSTKGVDFNDPRSVAAFDRRLQWAAAAACDSNEPGSLTATLSDSRCARESVARAVQQIDRPLLSKLHGQLMTMAMSDDSQAEGK
jgi:UrcA family protein